MKKSSYINFITLGFLIILCLSCTDSTKVISPVRKVFYSIDLLNTKKVYVYDHFYNDKLTKQIYETFEYRLENGDTVLYQESYDNNKNPLVLWIMKVKSDSVKLLRNKYYDNPYQGVKETESEIREGNILTFAFDTTSQSEDIIEINNDYKFFGRNRFHKEIIDSITFSNDRYLAMRFVDRISYIYYSDSSLINTMTISTYIEGIGYYESITDLRNNNYMTIRLNKIIDYEDWEK
jgi:hypothetical protein